jgi:hypothetical protein
MITYLISHSSGDLVGGLDVALLDGMAVLRSPQVLAWMSEQGFGPDQPDECVSLSNVAPSAQFPALKLHLSAADAALYQRVSAAEQAHSAD